METASWVVVSRATGEPVLETFNRKVAAAINLDRYQVIPVLEWLAGFNRSLAYLGT